ncbi:MAG: hydrogen gas-evolving membrane-bound hydrogenase subunit E [Halobacteriales archaeon]|nr:hydrogen gas-evolving membrane-bound hydrogenase subunit E [Halobacteriales archaeon]
MQPTQWVLFAVVFLPFLGAALVPIVYRVLGERTAYYAATVAAVCFGLVLSQYGRVGAVAIEWIPSMDVAIRFYLDGLALLIAFLASGVGILILTYSGGYMHDEPGQPKYYAALLAFMGSMLGVALAADLVTLFVFWELTSLASFVLIGHYQRTESSQYAARKSMLITVAGGLFMLVGFLLIHAVTGTWNLTALLDNAGSVQAELRMAGVFVPALALIAVGAAAKSAQVPLHIWLPNAMEAPTPVSAFLHSATMVKAGVYLVGRFRPLFASPEWMLVFTTLGLLTMTVTAVLAVGATDIKELLAYSTASHLGLIIAGFGFAAGLGGETAATIGGETGAFHILNHAVFKAALFLVAGIIAHEAGTRTISELGGLRHDLPITAGITVIAALGMAGVPPFNGFYSKELLFEAAYDAGHHLGGIWWLLPVVAVLGSVFTFLYSIRFLMLFFGDRSSALGEVHRPPTTMLAPPLLLAGIAAVIGISPGLAIDVIVQSTFESVGGHHEMAIGLPTKLKPAVVMSGVTIGLGLITYPVYDRLHDGIRSVLSLGPTTADFYYDGLVATLDRASRLLTPRVQTGLLRTYATWTIGGISALTLGGYIAAGVGIPSIPGITLSVPIVIVLAVAVLGAIAVTSAPSHIAGVLTLSILGFMVAIFYILASAPDLALTQLVIETLVLVIFLLVLDRLPAFYGETRGSRMIRDAVVSLFIGVTVFLTVLVSSAADPDAMIRTYFIDNAIPKGGGGNIVNVILVDFRAFDTMGEISVVAMAALSVLTLIGMRTRGETQR